MLSIELFFKAHNKPSFYLIRVTEIKDGLLHETFRIIWENECDVIPVREPYGKIGMEVTKEQYEKLYKELEGKINYVEKK